MTTQKVDISPSKQGIHQRRQLHALRVLGAVAKLLQPHTEPDGHANSTLGLDEIVAAAGVSKTTVRNSLSRWKNLRVLWLFHHKGTRSWEVRCDGQVLTRILVAWATKPHEVGRVIAAHLRHREQVAPRILRSNDQGEMTATAERRIRRK